MIVGVERRRVKVPTFQAEEEEGKKRKGLSKKRKENPTKQQDSYITAPAETG